MKAFCTTESHLRKMISADEKNVWHQIVNAQDLFVLSSEESDDFTKISNNEYLLNMHRAGKKIVMGTSVIKDLPDNPKYIEHFCGSVCVLDITPNKAANISRDYGLCCFPTESNIFPYLASTGWVIETTDDDIPHSWSFLLKNLKRDGSSALIIDRYLFASQWDKGNGDPDDTIQDSFDNLASILENIIPYDLENDIFVVTILFSVESVKNGGKGDFSPRKFEEIVEGIQIVAEALQRGFTIDIEVISIDSDCPFYNDTHDRFILSNYYYIEASHMLKAFKSRDNVSICKQRISMDYLYSRGIAPGDISSIPEKTKNRIINSIKNLLNEASSETIKYAINSKICDYNYKNIKNKLFKE